MTAELATVSPLPRPRGGWVDDLALSNLLARAAAGDRDAFLDFHDSTSHLVWRLELRRYRSRELAAAASRRRFVRAWGRAHQQAGSGLSPRAWLLSLPVADGRAR